MRRRRALRLRDFDYSSSHLYFVTACSRQHACIFGTVDNDDIRLSPLGLVARDRLLEIPRHYPRARIDCYVVMPNHVHVVLELGESGTMLGDVVGTYKAAVSRAAGPSGLWQRGYYDHVVRDEDDLARIREYVMTNPIRWALHPENPANAT